ncbi:MFS transporter permease [Microbacterium hominis]|uniref:MFS transporter permease n=1 Tax=Microbacterium hominis TaxID=162426 RepID=A0A7D4UB88_9MICO|nr:MFS transporter permease [Microbacterium hominis]QKJ19283.1 MFS transporter permease [Microbacterium hominis]
MWLRRAFFAWLVPAAFLLPVWLLVGWGVFNAGGWAFLWVLFLAIPGVFIWQLILTFLVRARGTVRAHRAVSWWDIAGFTVWHGLVIALGFFNPEWWAPVLVLALLAGVGMLWLELWQLWSEAKPTRTVLRTAEGVAYIPPTAEEGPEATASAHEVFVVTEKERRPRA